MYLKLEIVVVHAILMVTRMIRFRLLSIVGFSLLACTLASTAQAQTAEIRPIAFPTEGSATYADDFGDPRSGGRVHEGIDLIGKKMMPLYAAVTGEVRSVEVPEASWGCRVVLEDADGYRYLYYHVNNDTPGTDDGIGCGEYAYAPGITRRSSVTAGQLIGWMGDSGNAEAVGAHLHFEIRTPGGSSGYGDWGEDSGSTSVAINPYPSLINASFPGTYDADEAKAESPTINFDLGLVTSTGSVPCHSGALIKSASTTAVYYCGANGKRYVFPNDRIYFSWYANFKSVTTITNEQLAAIPLGGLVTYRPGVKMVKIESLPNVYAVTRGGVLRWIKTPAIAASIYGSQWSKNVDDVSDAFFGSYTIGEPITGIRP